VRFVPLAAVAVLLVSCSADSLSPANDPRPHPVAGGQWGPSDLDGWPTPLGALRFEGCRAYGGVTVETVIEPPVIETVQGGYGITGEGIPFVFIATPVIQMLDQVQQFLYYHICAHHLMQHAATRAVGDSLDLTGAEYDANCLAATHLLSDSIYTRRDIDFILLTLENNSGVERPPGQAQSLIACLQQQGLYQ